jgi:hypothetical protein
VKALHDEVGQGPGIGEILNADNSRVLQQGDGLRLSPKTRGKALVGGEVGVENFEGDVTLGLGIVGLVDLGHPPMTDLFDDAILIYRLAREVEEFSRALPVG